VALSELFQENEVAHWLGGYQAKSARESFEYIRQFAGVVFMTGSEILDWYNAVA
jgi:hypothetical protein